MIVLAGLRHASKGPQLAFRGQCADEYTIRALFAEEAYMKCENDPLMGARKR